MEDKGIKTHRPENNPICKKKIKICVQTYLNNIFLVKSPILMM